MLKNFEPLHRIYRCLRLLFHYRAPKLEHLDYLDVVVAQNPLLLISWNTKYPYLIKIPIVKKRYYTRSGSVLLKLPAGLQSIDVHVWSLWRKRTYVLAINSIAIDTGTFREYMSSHYILNSSILHNFEFTASTAFSIKLPAVKIYKTHPKISNSSIRVSIPLFQQNKT